MQVWQLQEPFLTITNLSELYFRFWWFILLVQTKKMISMSYDSSTSSLKPWKWLRLDLTLTMRDMYIDSNLDHSQNLPAEAEAPSLKIFSHRTSSNYHEDCPNQHQNSHKLCDDTEHAVVDLMESQWKLRQQHDQKWRESHCRTNTSVRRNK